MNMDIRSFGAMGNGKTLNTQAIQNAIDTTHAGGGGTVMVAQGRYLTGTLYLKSHVTLEIDSGAALVGQSLHRGLCHGHTQTDVPG